MLIDSSFEFADNVSAAAAAGSAVVGSTKTLDVTGRALGTSRNLYLVIIVSVAFASAGAATVQFQFKTDGVTPLVPATSTLHVASEVFAYTALTKGKRIILPIPSGIPLSELYAAVVAVTGTATTTAGSINAFITMDPEEWIAYPDAVN